MDFKTSMISSDWISKGDFVYRSKNPPIFRRSYGPYLEDIQGKKYFDAEAANGAALLGYDHSILEEAVAKIHGMPSLPSFAESELRLQVAEKIGTMIYKETNQRGQIAFEIGGAQAIELAAKIARKTTAKSQFVVFEGGYHGRSGYASQFSASHRYRKASGEWRIPVTRLPLPDYERSRFPGTKDEWKKWYLQEVDYLLENEAGGLVDNSEATDIAALIVEPILNVSGMILPDEQLFEKIIERFRRAGALIIIDEIFTGFYRTGKPFGFCRYNMVPDMIVMSKGLTNGQVPIGCVWAKAPLLDDMHFPPGSHSATFINNVMALAVADTVLDRYSRWETKERDINKIEKVLSTTINHICKKSTVFLQGYALGGLGRIILAKPIAHRLKDEALSLSPRVLNSLQLAGIQTSCKGLVLASTGMTPDVLCFHPPIHMSIQQCNEMSEILKSFCLSYD